MRLVFAQTYASDMTVLRLVIFFENGGVFELIVFLII